MSKSKTANKILLFLMTLLLIFGMAGCTTFQQPVFTPIEIERVLPAHPDPIVCKPINITKENEDKYTLDGKSHDNLIECLSDTARWIEQSGNIIEFYEK